MNYNEIVAALREEFPKANKATVSMALNTANYGVRFCKRAQDIFDEIAHKTPSKPRRTKPIRIQCRLTESTAQSVKHAMERHGISSVQTLLESLVLAWLKSENAAGGVNTDSVHKRKDMCSQDSTEREESQ